MDDKNIPFHLIDKIKRSKEILEEALSFNPFSTVTGFSGGDDSLVVMSLLRFFEFKMDFAIHADTGTGIPLTKKFVIDYCEENKVELLVTTPKKTLRDLVEKDGFLGVGSSAHNLSFGELKGKPIRDRISKEIRKGKRNRKVIIFSGLRRNESKSRATSKKYETPFWREKTGVRKNGSQSYSPNIWCALIHEWDKEDCLEFLDWIGQDRNEVSIKLGRSGDCHCGTAIPNPEKEFEQLKEYAPDVAIELSDMNQMCIDKGLTQWGVSRRKSHKSNQGDLFCGMDLCSKCENRLNVESIRSNGKNK